MGAINGSEGSNEEVKDLAFPVGPKMSGDSPSYSNIRDKSVRDSDLEPFGGTSPATPGVGPGSKKRIPESEANSETGHRPRNMTNDDIYPAIQTEVKTPASILKRKTSGDGPLGIPGEDDRTVSSQRGKKLNALIQDKPGTGTVKFENVSHSPYVPSWPYRSQPSRLITLFICTNSAFYFY